jgi:acetyl esterase
MGRSSSLLIFISACALAVQQAGAWQVPGITYPPQMDEAKVEAYKAVGDVKFKLYIFDPQGFSSADRRPAIVFFFGGGWERGTPQQFEQQCRYLASRGMVAITADYRVSSRNGVKVPESVRDAKSAIRWVRLNASRLGIDPSRIAAGGGSAGGHIAASAGVISGLDEPDEDPKVSSRPDALVLFNPGLVLAPVADSQIPDLESWRKFQLFLDTMPALAGVERLAISPYHHIDKHAPSTMILHGKADTTVPYATAELFTKKMIAAGNRCELVGFDGEDHGFFNYGRNGNKNYVETLRKVDEFLTSLGYLKGKPALP